MVEAMEIQEGFKQTEVGIIPSDWDAKPLGAVLKVRHGKSQKEVADTNGEYPILASGGVIGKANRYLYNKPSVLIGRKGTIDKPQFMTKPFWSVDTLFYTEIFENYSPEFLYYNFLLIDWYAYNEASGVPSLNAKTIEQIPIPFPPTKTEQTAIATALNDADALITQLEKLIAKKRAIKQGAMQELLKPKEGWEEKKLGDVISFVIDNRGKTPPLAKEGKPLIEVNAIYQQGKSPNYSLISKFVSQHIYDNWFRDGHPKKNDILVVTVGSAGATSYMNESIGCIAQNIIALRINNDFSSEFVYYFTLTRLFSEQVSQVLMGAVQPSLKVPHLERFIISLPSEKSEQIHIAQILSDMDAEIEALENKLNKYKMIKQGMMQNLLTGRIRLV